MLFKNSIEQIEQTKAIAVLLKERGATIATAESCTGGLLASFFTHLPGSSDWYLGGVSSYSNYAKIKLLGVQKEALDEYGAVSTEVAKMMAAGAARQLGSDYALSLTGIAGPGGGSEEKPVGMVCGGLFSPYGEKAIVYHLDGDREAIRAKAIAGIMGDFMALLSSEKG